MAIAKQKYSVPAVISTNICFFMDFKSALVPEREAVEEDELKPAMQLLQHVRPLLSMYV
jgi:hypothetical protein